MSAAPRLMPGAASIPRQTVGLKADSLAVSRAAVVLSSASTPSLRARDGTLPLHARLDPGGNVRVVVRVRAFLPRELAKDTECLIRMDPITQATTLLAPAAADGNDSSKAMAGWAKAATRRAAVEDRSFTFDSSFWSHDAEDAHYATQEDVYNSLGEEFLDHNFEGYHTCIFAYGQTGSGKSYTMMGTPAQPGLIPRTCEDLFQRIEAAHEETPNIAYNVRVSYFEVYNEHVRDLLMPVVASQPPYYLKIRESPTEGPYVKDLTEASVRSLDEILHYMQMGDASRTTASTKMNDTSSRSHAVFTILLRQIHHDMDTDETTERSSRIRLVDLAGSERAKATEATGQRLREGSNINKSLTTLGRVIAALAGPKNGGKSGKSGKSGSGSNSSSSSSKKRRGGAGGGRTPGDHQVVPYRDSILTWLLKDSLGGNSKTAMIACIAPGDYDETLSTLRYADQAKRIRTRAVVNQDSMSTAERDAQITSMAEEIRQLQLSVSDYSRRREKDAQQQEEHLEEYQSRVSAMQRMTEEKTLVAEGKIRSLQTENEALRLHLKLALDSLKNPIPSVAVPQKRRCSRASLQPTTSEEAEEEAERGERGERGEAADGDPDEDDGHLVDEAFYEDDFENEDDDDVDDDDNDDDDDENDDDDDNSDHGNSSLASSIYDDEQADDMEEYMQSLLADLGLFRRKIGDDKQRFIDGGGGGGGGGGGVGVGVDLFGTGRRPLTPRTNV